MVHLSGMLCAVKERTDRIKQLLDANKTWNAAQSFMITKKKKLLQFGILNS